MFWISQVQLVNTILKENIMSCSLSNDDVTTSEHSTSALSHLSEVAASDEKLDSGIGSECSHKNRQPVKSHENHQPNVQEMEFLVTARGLSMFVYEKCKTAQARTRLVPVVRVSLIQPSFNCTRRTDCDTVQISCFDVSLAKCNSDAESAG